ncbi:preprotein translocase subunit YajC [Streptococcus didelphis]|uniref:preprotein translocase subunit YajC n=1 Tax=Streptococcus didelphis TaxID=102886 RepID=UPI00036D958F|nr:preprotein translocase subunit YajC [Streptococcus didelphis]
MGFSTILMFVVMIGLIFFMQRQQKKQAKERQNQLNTIEKGDEVVTIGGLFAFVDEIDKETNRIVLDVDGVFLPFELSAIKRVVSKYGAELLPVDENKAESASLVEDDTLPLAEETALDTNNQIDSVIETK